MSDLDPRDVDVILRGDFFDDGFVAGENDIHTVFILRIDSSFDDFERRVVAAESVYNNFHISTTFSDVKFLFKFF